MMRRPASYAVPSGGLELLRGTGRGPLSRKCARRAPSGGRACLDRSCTGCGLLPHLGVDLGCEAGILAQVVADVLPALTETLVSVRHPRPTLLEDRVLDGGIDQ